jgi:hypothetical protein
MHKKSGVAPFIFGLILGILCTIYLPKYVQPYLPAFMAGKQTVVKGTVTAKEKKADTLLLTVNTPDGALLATFRKKADEVNLLVNEKDDIQFILPKYLPFVNDPKIIRVVKEQQTAPAPSEAAAAPAGAEENSTKGVRPRHRANPQAAAPSSRNTMEMKPQSQASGSFPAGDKKTGQ